MSEELGYIEFEHNPPRPEKKGEKPSDPVKRDPADRTIGNHPELEKPPVDPQKKKSA